MTHWPLTQEGKAWLSRYPAQTEIRAALVYLPTSLSWALYLGPSYEMGELVVGGGEGNSQRT